MKTDAVKETGQNILNSIFMTVNQAMDILLSKKDTPLAINNLKNIIIPVNDVIISTIISKLGGGVPNINSAMGTSVFSIIADSISKRGEFITVGWEKQELLNAYIVEDNIEVKSDFVKLLAGVAQNTLSAIKEVYIPEIKRLSMIFEEALRDQEVPSIVSKYSISQISIPKVVSDMIDSGMITDPRPAENLPNIRLELKRPESIRDYIRAEGDIDSQLLSLVSSKSDSELETLWNDYLNIVSNESTAILNLPTVNIINLDRLVILYYLINNLITNYQDVEVRESISFKQVMMKYSMEILNHISRILRLYKESIETETVILGVNNNTINVLEPMYVKAIENGVTPDAIIGVVLHSPIPPYAQTILPYLISEKDKLSRITSDQVKVEKMAMVQSVKSRITSLVAPCFIKWVTSLSPEVLKYSTKSQSVSKFLEFTALTTKETQHDKYDISVENILSDIANDRLTRYDTERAIYEISKYFVSIIMDRVNCYHLLSRIEEFTNDNPETNMDDVVTFAVTKFLTEYLCSTFRIGKNV